MKKRLIIRLVIKAIRKYFSDGLMLITDYEGNPIAYQWTWSKEVDDGVK